LAALLPFYATETALDVVLAEWNSGESYPQRIAGLSNAR